MCMYLLIPKLILSSISDTCLLQTTIKQQLFLTPIYIINDQFIPE